MMGVNPIYGMHKDISFIIVKNKMVLGKPSSALNELSFYRGIVISS